MERGKQDLPRDGREFYEAKQHCASRFGMGESMLQAAQRIYNLLDELKARHAKAEAST